MKLTLDIESYSEVDLKTAGMYRYAEDESTDLLCVCWAFDDGPVSTWIPGNTLPPDLIDYIRGSGELHAWNAAFERNVLNGPAGAKYGFPRISIEQTRCSMARARACGLPGALANAAKVLNTAIQKNTDGLNAMRYLCKPRPDGTRPKDETRFQRLLAYCADDVRAERCIDDMLPPMSPKETKVYHLDQKVNDRGIKVDLKAIDDIEALIKEYKDYLRAKCKELTGLSPSAPVPLANWIRTTGGLPGLEDLQADTVRRIVEREDTPEVAKTVLKIFSTYNMKAVAKFPAIRKAVCKDGRIHGMFNYHAAATGRWASTIVQLHNTYRGVIDDPDTAIAACALRDLDWIRMLYPGVDPMKIFASCVRGCLIAEEGKELVFPDFSGVEARWVAWIFGEEWKLNLWRAGEDTYVDGYARAFSVPAATVTKRQRLIGKVLELSMQYEGGVGAFIKLAHNYGLDMNELLAAFPLLPTAIQDQAQYNYEYAKEQDRIYGLEEDVWLACEGLKIAWRENHPRVRFGWKQLLAAAKTAVEHPGEVYKISKIMFKVEAPFLIMRLPSGRRSYYYKPRLVDDELHYEGIDTETRQWGPTSTYGGRLCENMAQGGCRDLLADAMLRFDAAGWDIVAHVHDEPILEAPIGALKDETVHEIMCEVPNWAEGFPIAIEGHKGKRYRK